MIGKLQLTRHTWELYLIRINLSVSTKYGVIREASVTAYHGGCVGVGGGGCGGVNNKNNRSNNNNNNWYEHVPKSVETCQGGKVTILWNQQAQTDRTIPNNKPVIIIRNNEKGTCILIDVAISGDRNVIKKEAEKILMHKDLTIEIQRMWNVKTKATGTISKSFRIYVSNMPGKHEVKELQKTAILGTAHILRKVLM